MAQRPNRLPGVVSAMFLDHTTGRHYSTAEALRQVQEARAAQWHRLRQAVSDQQAAAAQRISELRGQWDDIAVGTSVLLSGQLSQRLFKATATPFGQIQIDGLLMEVGDDGRGLVRIHFLRPRGLGSTATTAVKVARNEVEGLGHPFSWWHEKDPRRTAIERDQQHNRAEGWASAASNRYWSE